MGQARRKVGVVVPHSHTWLNTQTCVAKLIAHTDPADVDIVVVDNSWDWSPSIRGITETALGSRVRVIPNPVHYYHRVHGSALDVAFANMSNDLIVTVETDAIPLRDGWLGFFLAHLEKTDYAAGAWHHQQFANPSFTLYRREAWERMKVGHCATFPAPKHNAYWGPEFRYTGHITPEEAVDSGPFCERRGWPPGTTMRHYPHMLNLGPYHYEPGQAFYHWATEFGGYTFGVVPFHDTHLNGIPTGTYYGWTEGKDISKAFAVHYWGGTRALDPIKHKAFVRFFNDPTWADLNDTAIGPHRPYWINREVSLWKQHVAPEIREQTLGLIGKHGWVNGPPTPLEQTAITEITNLYRASGLRL